MATPRTPPHDLDAETALLGAMLLTRDATTTAEHEGVTAADLYAPRHADLYEAITKTIAAGELPDPVAVAPRLPGDTTANVRWCREVQAATPASANAAAYARRVRTLAVRRRILAAAGDLDRAAHSGDDPTAILEHAIDLTRHTNGQAAHPDVHEWLTRATSPYDWLIEGLLERTDRVILVGYEGHGKSTLLRQFAVQAAAGIHPFTLEQVPPVKVMLLDLENSARHVHRKLSPLVAKAGDALTPGSLYPVVLPGGLDLTGRHDADELRRTVAAVQPDIIVGGPLYKLHNADPTDEEPAKKVAYLFDQIRTEHQAAIVLEAHAPHAAGKTHRVERPYGASLWLRWPEFGLFLSDAGALRHWRGARDEREWPTLLKRGGDWPWMAVTDARAVTFAKMLDVVAEAGGAPSNYDIAKAVGCSEPTVRRAISANTGQWAAAVAAAERAGEKF